MALAVDFARQAGDSASARTSAGPAGHPRRHSGQPADRAEQRQPPPDRPGAADFPAGRQGRSNRDIALEMGVSVRTVEGHLYQVFTKLGVTSRGDLPGLV